MVRIVLDPDEVNQAQSFTLTDGRVVDLSAADAGLLERIDEQLRIHRSSYVHAFVPQDDEVAERLIAGEARVEDVAPLYVRVASLKSRVRSGYRREPTELEPAALLQAETWTSSSGVQRPLEELTPTHRRNLVGWLERHSEDLERRFGESDLDSGRVEPADPWVAGTPLYRRLEQLIEEESGRDQAIDRARQVVRQVEFDRSGTWPET